MKNMFGKQKNWTKEQVLSNLNKTRRYEGFHSGAHWSVHVGKGEQILFEAAWRQNPEKAELVCAWESEKELDDFLKKKLVNHDYVTKEILKYEQGCPKDKTENPARYQEQIAKISLRAPYSPLELQRTALLCCEFDPDQIVAYVEMLEQTLLQNLGVLPSKPQVIPLYRDRIIKDYVPLVRVMFKT
jgi:hypothetical protein